MITWRPGRKVHRTLYAVDADRPDEDGVLIGMMDTPELARLASAAPDMLAVLETVSKASLCPVCFAVREEETCEPDCALAAAIRKARGE